MWVWWRLPVKKILSHLQSKSCSPTSCPPWTILIALWSKYKGRMFAIKFDDAGASSAVFNTKTFPAEIAPINGSKASPEWNQSPLYKLSHSLTIDSKFMLQLSVVKSVMNPKTKHKSKMQQTYGKIPRGEDENNTKRFRQHLCTWREKSPWHMNLKSQKQPPFNEFLSKFTKPQKDKRKCLTFWEAIHFLRLLRA